MATRSNKQKREAAFGRFVLAMLCADGPDASDRLGRMVEEAQRLGLAQANTAADEDTDPWTLPPSPACGHSTCRQNWIDNGCSTCVAGDAPAWLAGDDDGCPKDDPDCTGGNGDCHDACERPKARP